MNYIPWKTLKTYGAMLLAWIVLVGWLSYLLYTRAQISRQNDEASVREWLDETRVFRKTLLEMIEDYITKLDNPDNENLVPLETKAEEIRAQLRSLTFPLQTLANQLPLFPDVERIEIRFPNNPEVNPITWETLDRKPQILQNTLRTLQYEPITGRAIIYCRYHLHAFNRTQRDEREQQLVFRIIGGVVIIGSLLALLAASSLLRRERNRELARLRAERALEHKENEVLNEKLRAEEAERTALEMKSQLFAGIGIMAGSYAHNIKNLLVRPNDLIHRCLEQDGLNSEQLSMMHEVRSTLGTVTERLQEILKTVRRDPTQTAMSPLDLNHLVNDMTKTWSQLCTEKWKLNLQTDLWSEPLIIDADLSHLQQALENLLFNARDATFEMRNHVRDEARNAEPALRKQALIDAAGWRGLVIIRTYREDSQVLLDIQDNGIGMTDEVRERCVETHFTTKRNNALYEGYNAGMGLGLSFVMAVLEHHGAKLEIYSTHLKGTTFRVRFL
ncbi:HAMP domain-containing histidine kinase [Telmatocola sphagniphila]|uniref:histidine kinase n=1 Tax=Telmatocola sphagniphila TaxID=1123043 RepID=A0A8E6ETV8_9BACT|nr:HAMP domain-containing sensor histidine kinase [Telmatocola sphagniphila]QVL30610.1 HAMP domain-containing histidine kinase [Telmatocola sphagniphila]